MTSLSHFIHQKSYERIEHKVRRDPLILVPSLFYFLILTALPFGVYLLTVNVFPLLYSIPASYITLVLLTGSYYLLLGLVYYTHFINYYLDLLILTNDRLIHIEQHGIFSRSISEVDLYRIQDITSEVKGFFPSLFSFGGLLVQTAGATDKFIIKNIPEPEQLRHKVILLAEEDRKFHTSVVLPKTLPLK